jgi:hypothetical protein
LYSIQECERFNKLLVRMKFTLDELQRAIKGLVVMSTELESMFNNFLSNQVKYVIAYEKDIYYSINQD